MRLEELALTDKHAVRGWLKGFHQEVLVVRQVFTNKDSSTGLLNVACSDLTCDDEQVTTIYKKRWKSRRISQIIKIQRRLGEVPTRKVTTQNNHVIMSFYAVFKLECLN